MKTQIREYRREHNLTQRQLAQKIGASLQLISMVERGARGISKDLALLLNNLDPERFPLDELLKSKKDAA